MPFCVEPGAEFSDPCESFSVYSIILWFCDCTVLWKVQSPLTDSLMSCNERRGRTLFLLGILNKFRKLSISSFTHTTECPCTKATDMRIWGNLVLTGHIHTCLQHAYTAQKGRTLMKQAVHSVLSEAFTYAVSCMLFRTSSEGSILLFHMGFSVSAQLPYSWDLHFYLPAQHRFEVRGWQHPYIQEAAGSQED